MSWLSDLIFGRWEEQSNRLAEARFVGLFSPSGPVEVSIIIERNRRTGKRRAFMEFPSGKRSKISISMADRKAKEAGLDVGGEE